MLAGAIVHVRLKDEFPTEDLGIISLLELSYCTDNLNAIISLL